MIGYRNDSGYVALLSVLIVGAVALAIGVAMLVSGTDSQREVLVAQQSTQARNLATACGEEGLQQIHDNTAFTGTNNITLGQGTCTYTVANTGASTRTVDATGTVNGVVRRIKIYVTINVSSLSITSWQDVL